MDLWLDMSPLEVKINFLTKTDEMCLPKWKFWIWFIPINWFKRLFVCNYHWPSPTRSQCHSLNLHYQPASHLGFNVLIFFKIKFAYNGPRQMNLVLIAPLNGWTCVVKICHDGMLEDINSLDAPHMYILTMESHLFQLLWEWLYIKMVPCFCWGTLL